MEQTRVGELAKKLQISPEQVVREEYELFFLRDLFGSSFGPNLVFKEGTALRLAYGSLRFSDDLDFSVLKRVNTGKFAKVIQGIGNRYPKVKISDVRRKKNTLFALIKIKEEFLPLAFSIKIEISTRAVDWETGVDYLVKTLSSEVTPVAVVGQTASLLRIKKDKQLAIKTRKRGRDLYDLWLVSSQLREEFKVPKHKLSLKELKMELNKLLPLNERYVVEQLVFKGKQ